MFKRLGREGGFSETHQNISLCIYSGVFFRLEKGVQNTKIPFKIIIMESDMTYLPLRIGENNLEIKADRAYRSNLSIDEQVSFDINSLYFFDTETGIKIR